MRLRLSHLPTWLLIIGYPVFWAELQWHPGAHTSWLAAILFLAVSAVYLVDTIKKRPAFTSLSPSSRTLQVWLLLGSFILVLSLIASLLPPHLPQEGDALNYHLSIPRQHLILGSFRHLPWSIADLWLLPIQFGLAPYWFLTPFPNKFPQFIFLLGLLAVSLSVTKKLTSRPISLWAIAASILGSHGFGIQFGSAMLDLTIAYLFIAAIDSLWAGDWIFAAVEFSFYIWSKSFIPLQVALLLIGLSLAELIRRWTNGRWVYAFEDGISISFVCWKKTAGLLIFLSIFVGGPFIAKSMQQAGTPLFPFCAFHWGGHLAANPVSRTATLQCQSDQLSWRTSYGEGRSLKAFFTHFWRIAVPSKGVNNAFDYPMGLPYLLCAGPFIWMLGRSLHNRKFPLLPLLAILFWSIWWMGSQQSRWLYVPLILIFVSTLSVPWVSENRFLAAGLTLALLTTAVSIFRVHMPDIQHLPNIPIRNEDLRLWEDSKRLKPGERIHVLTKEVAYSEAPVDVDADDPIWVLPTP